MALPRWHETDEIDVLTLQRRLGQWEDAFMHEALAAADQIGQELVTYARQHHLWKPITGETDRTTQYDTYFVSGEIGVRLTTETPWAVYLETARGGKFAWFMPTMIAMQGRILTIWTERLR